MAYMQQEGDVSLVCFEDITVFYDEQAEIVTITEESTRGDNVMLTRDEAIAAARAILKHFHAE